jgi:hypothetical protein
MTDNRDIPDANRDPLSNEPGAHPIGTGIGAAAAGATGAAVGGALGGPLGAVIGATVGAVAGAATGKEAAEALNPTVEDDHWREMYPSRPYARVDQSYEVFRPAYRYGWESPFRYSGRSWDEVEADMEAGWEAARGTCTLSWEDARFAVRDAWDRVGHRVRY